MEPDDSSGGDRPVIKQEPVAPRVQLASGPSAPFPRPSSPSGDTAHQQIPQQNTNRPPVLPSGNEHGTVNSMHEELRQVQQQCAQLNHHYQVLQTVLEENANLRANLHPFSQSSTSADLTGGFSGFGMTESRPPSPIGLTHRQGRTTSVPATSIPVADQQNRRSSSALPPLENSPRHTRERDFSLPPTHFSVLAKAQAKAVIPIFTGKKGEFKAWYNKASDVIEFLGLSLNSPQGGPMARNSLQGRALNHIRQVDGDRTMNFVQIATELAREFEEQDIVSATAYLMRMRPQTYESSADYLYRLQEAHHCVTGNQPPSAERDGFMIGIALQNLPEELKSRLRASDARLDFKSFRDKVREEEHFMDSIMLGKMPRRATALPSTSTPTTSQDPPARRGIIKNVNPQVRFQNNEFRFQNNDITAAEEQGMLDKLNKRMDCKFADMTNSMTNMLTEVRDRMGVTYQNSPFAPEAQGLEPSISPNHPVKEDGCYHCGSKTHWRNKCPDRFKRHGPDPRSFATQARRPPYDVAALGTQQQDYYDYTEDYDFNNYDPIKTRHPLHSDSIQRSAVQQFENAASLYEEDMDLSIPEDHEYLPPCTQLFSLRVNPSCYDHVTMVNEVSDDTSSNSAEVENPDQDSDLEEPLSEETLSTTSSQEQKSLLAILKVQIISDTALLRELRHHLQHLKDLVNSPDLDVEEYSTFTKNQADSLRSVIRRIIGKFDKLSPSETKPKDYPEEDCITGDSFKKLASQLAEIGESLLEELNRTLSDAEVINQKVGYDLTKTSQMKPPDADAILRLWHPTGTIENDEVLKSICIDLSQTSSLSSSYSAVSEISLDSPEQPNPPKPSEPISKCTFCFPDISRWTGPRSYPTQKCPEANVDSWKTNSEYTPWTIATKEHQQFCDLKKLLLRFDPKAQIKVGTSFPFTQIYQELINIETFQSCDPEVTREIAAHLLRETEEDTTKSKKTHTIHVTMQIHFNESKRQLELRDQIWNAILRSVPIETYVFEPLPDLILDYTPSSSSNAVSKFRGAHPYRRMKQLLQRFNPEAATKITDDLDLPFEATLLALCGTETFRTCDPKLTDKIEQYLKTEGLEIPLSRFQEFSPETLIRVMNLQIDLVNAMLKSSPIEDFLIDEYNRTQNILIDEYNRNLKKDKTEDLKKFQINTIQIMPDLEDNARNSEDSLDDPIDMECNESIGNSSDSHESEDYFDRFSEDPINLYKDFDFHPHLHFMTPCQKCSGILSTPSLSEDEQQNLKDLRKKAVFAYYSTHGNGSDGLTFEETLQTLTQQKSVGLQVKAMIAIMRQCFQEEDTIKLEEGITDNLARIPPYVQMRLIETRTKMYRQMRQCKNSKIFKFRNATDKPQLTSELNPETSSSVKEELVQSPSKLACDSSQEEIFMTEDQKEILGISDSSLMRLFNKQFEEEARFQAFNQRSKYMGLSAHDEVCFNRQRITFKEQARKFLQIKEYITEAFANSPFAKVSTEKPEATSSEFNIRCDTIIKMEDQEFVTQGYTSGKPSDARKDFAPNDYYLNNPPEDDLEEIPDGAQVAQMDPSANALPYARPRVRRMQNGIRKSLISGQAIRQSYDKDAINKIRIQAVSGDVKPLFSLLQEEALKETHLAKPPPEEFLAAKELFKQILEMNSQPSYATVLSASIAKTKALKNKLMSALPRTLLERFKIKTSIPTYCPTRPAISPRSIAAHQARGPPQGKSSVLRPYAAGFLQRMLRNLWYISILSSANLGLPQVMGVPVTRSTTTQQPPFPFEDDSTDQPENRFDPLRSNVYPDVNSTRDPLDQSIRPEDSALARHKRAIPLVRVVLIACLISAATATTGGLSYWVHTLRLRAIEAERLNAQLHVTLVQVLNTTDRAISILERFRIQQGKSRRDSSLQSTTPSGPQYTSNILRGVQRPSRRCFQLATDPYELARDQNCLDQMIRYINPKLTPQAISVNETDPDQSLNSSDVNPRFPRRIRRTLFTPKPVNHFPVTLPSGKVINSSTPLRPIHPACKAIAVDAMKLAKNATCMTEMIDFIWQEFYLQRLNKVIQPTVPEDPPSYQQLLVSFDLPPNALGAYLALSDFSSAVSDYIDQQGPPEFVLYEPPQQLEDSPVNTDHRDDYINDLLKSSRILKIESVNLARITKNLAPLPPEVLHPNRTKRSVTSQVPQSETTHQRTKRALPTIIALAVASVLTVPVSVGLGISIHRDSMRASDARRLLKSLATSIALRQKRLDFLQAELEGLEIGPELARFNALRRPKREVFDTLNETRESPIIRTKRFTSPLLLALVALTSGVLTTHVVTTATSRSPVVEPVNDPFSAQERENIASQIKQLQDVQSTLETSFSTLNQSIVSDSSSSSREQTVILRYLKMYLKATNQSYASEILDSYLSTLTRSKRDTNNSTETPLKRNKRAVVGLVTLALIAILVIAPIVIFSPKSRVISLWEKLQESERRHAVAKAYLSDFESWFDDLTSKSNLSEEATFTEVVESLTTNNIQDNNTIITQTEEDLPLTRSKRQANETHKTLFQRDDRTLSTLIATVIVAGLTASPITVTETHLQQSFHDWKLQIWQTEQNCLRTLDSWMQTERSAMNITNDVRIAFQEELETYRSSLEDLHQNLTSLHSFETERLQSVLKLYRPTRLVLHAGLPKECPEDKQRHDLLMKIPKISKLLNLLNNTMKKPEENNSPSNFMSNLEQDFDNSSETSSRRKKRAINFVAAAIVAACIAVPTGLFIGASVSKNNLKKTKEQIRLDEIYLKKQWEEEQRLVKQLQKLTYDRISGLQGTPIKENATEAEMAATIEAALASVKDSMNSASTVTYDLDLAGNATDIAAVMLESAKAIDLLNIENILTDVLNSSQLNSTETILIQNELTRIKTDRARTRHTRAIAPIYFISGLATLSTTVLSIPVLWATIERAVREANADSRRRKEGLKITRREFLSDSLRTAENHFEKAVRSAHLVLQTADLTWEDLANHSPEVKSILKRYPNRRSAEELDELTPIHPLLKFEEDKKKLNKLRQVFSRIENLRQTYDIERPEENITSETLEGSAQLLTKVVEQIKDHQTNYVKARINLQRLKPSRGRSKRSLAIIPFIAATMLANSVISIPFADLVQGDIPMFQRVDALSRANVQMLRDVLHLGREMALLRKIIVIMGPIIKASYEKRIARNKEIQEQSDSLRARRAASQPIDLVKIADRVTNQVVTEILRNYSIPELNRSELTSANLMNQTRHKRALTAPMTAVVTAAVTAVVSSVVTGTVVGLTIDHINKRKTILQEIKRVEDSQQYLDDYLDALNRSQQALSNQLREEIEMLRSNISCFQSNSNITDPSNPSDDPNSAKSRVPRTIVRTIEPSEHIFKRFVHDLEEDQRVNLTQYLEQILESMQYLKAKLHSNNTGRIIRSLPSREESLSYYVKERTAVQAALKEYLDTLNNTQRQAVIRVMQRIYSSIGLDKFSDEPVENPEEPNRRRRMVEADRELNRTRKIISNLQSLDIMLNNYIDESETDLPPDEPLINLDKIVSSNRGTTSHSNSNFSIKLLSMIIISYFFGPGITTIFSLITSSFAFALPATFLTFQYPQTDLRGNETIFTQDQLTVKNITAPILLRVLVDDLQNIMARIVLVETNLASLIQNPVLTKGASVVTTSCLVGFTLLITCDQTFLGLFLVMLTVAFSLVSANPSSHDMLREALEKEKTLIEAAAKLEEQRLNTRPGLNERPAIAPIVHEEWTFKPLPRHKPLTETPDMIASSPLQNILAQGQLRLGAQVNLGIGAALVPQGVVLLKPATVWLSFVVEMVAPHWLPVELRHPLTDPLCKDIKDLNHRAKCVELLDPHKARRKCDHTRAIEVVTDNLLGEIRDRYQNSMNPAINIQMLKKLCTRHKLMCSYISPITQSPANSTHTRKQRTPFSPEDETHQETRSSRNRRFAFLPFLAAIGFLTSTAIAAGTAIRVSALDSQMSTIAPRLETLRQGLESDIGHTKDLTTLTAEGFEHIYDVIESVRCLTILSVEETQLVLMANSYRNYLTAQMEAIVEMAQSGRVSPILLGADRLTELIRKERNLHTSLLSQEPHLFYAFAKGFPVRLDFQGFRFGFIVEVPVPTTKDTLLRYSIHNVGFHGKDLPVRDNRFKTGPHPRILVHRARLPETVLLRSDSVLSPLRFSECQTEGALSLCPLTALIPAKNYPCLPLMIDPSCGVHCDVNRECAADIAVTSEPPSPEIANSNAGVLIRAPYGEITAFYLPAAQRPLDSAHVIPVTNERTQFVDNATELMIDDRGFTPSFGPLVSAHVYDRTQVNITSNFVLPTDTKAWETLLSQLDSSQHVMKIAKIAFEQYQPSSWWSTLSTFVAWFAVLLFLSMIFVCCLSKHCKSPSLDCLRPWQEDGDFISRDELPFLFTFFPGRAFKIWLCQEADKNIDVNSRTFSTARSLSSCNVVVGNMAGPSTDNRKDRSGAPPEPPPTSCIKRNKGCLPSLHTFKGARTLDSRDSIASLTSDQSNPTVNTSMLDADLNCTPKASQVCWLTVPPHTVPRADGRRSHPLYPNGMLYNYLPRTHNVSNVRNYNFHASRDTQTTIDDLMPQFNADNDVSDENLGMAAGISCVPIAAMVDTGAAVSIITKTLANKMNAIVLPLADRLRKSVESATGDIMPMEGYTKIALYLGGSLYPHKFFVRQKQMGEDTNPHVVNAILGNDILSKIGQILVDHMAHTLTFLDPKRRTKQTFPLDPIDDQIIIRSLNGDFTIGQSNSKTNLPSVPPGAFTNNRTRSQENQNQADRLAGQPMRNPIHPVRNTPKTQPITNNVPGQGRPRVRVIRGTGRGLPNSIPHQQTQRNNPPVSSTPRIAPPALPTGFTIPRITRSQALIDQRADALEALRKVSTTPRNSTVQPTPQNGPSTSGTPRPNLLPFVRNPNSSSTAVDKNTVSVLEQKQDQTVETDQEDYYPVYFDDETEDPYIYVPDSFPQCRLNATPSGDGTFLIPFEETIDRMLEFDHNRQNVPETPKVKINMITTGFGALSRFPFPDIQTRPIMIPRPQVPGAHMLPPPVGKLVWNRFAPLDANYYDKRIAIITPSRANGYEARPPHPEATTKSTIIKCYVKEVIDLEGNGSLPLPYPLHITEQIGPPAVLYRVIHSEIENHPDLTIDTLVNIIADLNVPEIRLYACKEPPPPPLEDSYEVRTPVTDADRNLYAYMITLSVDIDEPGAARSPSRLYFAELAQGLVIPAQEPFTHCRVYPSAPSQPYWYDAQGTLQGVPPSINQNVILEPQTLKQTSRVNPSIASNGAPMLLRSRSATAPPERPHSMSTMSLLRGHLTPFEPSGPKSYDEALRTLYANVTEPPPPYPDTQEKQGEVLVDFHFPPSSLIPETTITTRVTVNLAPGFLNQEGYTPFSVGRHIIAQYALTNVYSRIRIRPDGRLHIENIQNPFCPSQENFNNNARTGLDLIADLMDLGAPLPPAPNSQSFTEESARHETMKAFKALIKEASQQYTAITIEIRFTGSPALSRVKALSLEGITHLQILQLDYGGEYPIILQETTATILPCSLRGTELVRIPNSCPTPTPLSQNLTLTFSQVARNGTLPENPRSRTATPPGLPEFYPNLSETTTHFLMGGTRRSPSPWDIVAGTYLPRMTNKSLPASPLASPRKRPTPSIDARWSGASCPPLNLYPNLIPNEIERAVSTQVNASNGQPPPLVNRSENAETTTTNSLPPSELEKAILNTIPGRPLSPDTEDYIDMSLVMQAFSAHTNLAYNLGLYQTPFLELKATITFQPRLLIGIEKVTYWVDLLGNLGAAQPTIPIPGATSNCQIVAVYEVLRVRSSLNVDNPYRLFADSILADPSPEVEIIYRGNNAVRRGLHYPMDLPTGIIIHTHSMSNRTRSFSGLEPVIQISEYAITTPRAMGQVAPRVFPFVAQTINQFVIRLHFRPAPQNAEASWHDGRLDLYPIQNPLVPRNANQWVPVPTHPIPVPHGRPVIPPTERMETSADIPSRPSSQGQPSRPPSRHQGSLGGSGINMISTNLTKNLHRVKTRSQSRSSSGREEIPLLSSTPDASNQIASKIIRRTDRLQRRNSQKLVLQSLSKAVDRVDKLQTTIANVINNSPQQVDEQLPASPQKAISTTKDAVNASREFNIFTDQEVLDEAYRNVLIDCGIYPLSLRPPSEDSDTDTLYHEDWNKPVNFRPGTLSKRVCFVGGDDVLTFQREEALYNKQLEIQSAKLPTTSGSNPTHFMAL